VIASIFYPDPKELPFFQFQAFTKFANLIKESGLLFLKGDQR